ncbi:DUF4402 domain-containing protein [Christiangramia sp. SM2212]|uniref:DUF4402 domain-containing protein n=1 Tax=Christiangramia sediminicola TaxID=3073267 RepID=A0ABU1EPX3_9FLAO|nr:DUF4402 domain-containing protein [Christiangramia sp. SM2212]MDR5590213.1 DUF4402 domain-containing protein [Christiangramia sp. SM2212]
MMTISPKHTGFFLFMILALIISGDLSAQENPPIPTNVEVNPVNVMNFGSFLVNADGGTLSMDYNSIRTPGAGVMLMNSGEPAAAAIFDVYANPGTILRVSHSSPFMLSGTGGGTITLNLDSFLANGEEILDGFFITTENAEIPNTVFIGGTLTMGQSEASPPGRYSGTITLTFIQE